MEELNITQSPLERNMDKYVEFASWILWYPDLFLDLIKPEEGGITLHADQRIFLRCALRFFSMYGCFPRGWGKTWDEVIAMVITAIRYPNIELSLTAQTKDNAAELLKDKIQEILRQYPMLSNEIFKTKFQKGDAEVSFKNGARIDVLANSQNSKGQRRKRINIEESALLDAATFDDALKPIVEVSRYTCGKLAIINPEELNQQIHFFTTPGWRGSDEYVRNMQMIRNMVDLKGEIVLGSDWKLGSWYGRGSSKSQILQKKKQMSPIAFDQNYGGRWTGSSDNALINVNRLMNSRTLTKAQLKTDDYSHEYYMGVDVARSQNTNNNQSSVVIGRVHRDENTNKIRTIDIVNVLNISNTINFTGQAIIIKKIKEAYNAKAVVCDGNGLGSGLIDELLKNTVDPVTQQTYECWDTINTDNKPETPNAEKCLYDLKAQSAQTRIITNFIDLVDAGKLRLLEKRDPSGNYKNPDLELIPFVQTDLLFEEVNNLKIKYLSSGALSVEKVVSKLDKDRYSALVYMLWYITEFCNKPKQNTITSTPFILSRPAKSYKR
ncbi:MAG: hypothetical protein II304_07590 [Bacteroidales bacterium]|nr:hypothetical protein [Bacteroidales bacterium]